jgi:hypothetical protein
VHYQWNTCQYLVETEYHLAVCCATYGPPIRSTVQTRNYVRSNIWKCIDFLNTLYAWRNIMFYFIAIQDWTLILHKI